MSRVELRIELLATLKQGRKVRRHIRVQDRRGEIPNFVNIHQRPPEVNERVIPGCWGGDLIKGWRNASDVATLVEHTSLFVTLAKVTGGGVYAAVEGFSIVLNRIVAKRLFSMSYNQGREMSQNANSIERTSVKIYFSDPRSP